MKSCGTCALFVTNEKRSKTKAILKGSCAWVIPANQLYHIHKCWPSALVVHKNSVMETEGALCPAFVKSVCDARKK